MPAPINLLKIWNAPNVVAITIATQPLKLINLLLPSISISNITSIVFASLPPKLSILGKLRNKPTHYWLPSVKSLPLLLKLWHLVYISTSVFIAKIRIKDFGRAQLSLLREKLRNLIKMFLTWIATNATPKKHFPNKSTKKLRELFSKRWTSKFKVHLSSTS